MLEKPALADEKILARLRDVFGLEFNALEFLPIGNDSRAWAFRVQAAGEQVFFLKLRQGPLYPASLLVPHFLQEQGLRQVIAPLPNRQGALSSPLEDYQLILYPFVEGSSGMQLGLTPAQWSGLGAALRRMHDLRLPESLAAQVNHETFRPAWAEMVRRLDAAVQSGAYTEPQQHALAVYWQQKRAEILRILDRTEELGRLLQSEAPPYCLCHADIHTANVLLDARGELYIIDWDGVILAPKERDLMFMVERKPAEQDAIFQGYGPAAIHRLALAYYRFEWVVQEIGDFGERIFFAQGTSHLTKDDSLRGFRALFDPQDVVELAYQSEIE